MASIVFPLNPLVGEVFPALPDLPIWSCAGTNPSIWNKITSDNNAASRVIISDVAPTIPNSGDEWYNSSNGNKYIWYIDSDSSQWIMI